MLTKATRSHIYGTTAAHWTGPAGPHAPGSPTIRCKALNERLQKRRFATESYLLGNKLLTERQLERAWELVRLWQGDLPVVLWKMGLIDLDTLAMLIEL